MTERPNAVTMKGSPKTLLGKELKVGDAAPDFSLKANDMSDKSLADFDGKVKLVSVVPSIDTAVCGTETRTFNEKAASLGDDIVILTVSIDTPMAQKRFCAAHDIEQVHMLSDFKDHTFGPAWGVRIKETGMLARQVFVVDKNNKIVYTQLVKEVADEPDYDAALNAAKSAM